MELSSMKKILILVLFSMFFAGCSGKIYTVRAPEFKNNKTEGVLFYGYKIKEKSLVLDRIRNTKTGEITHSMYEPKDSSKYCAPNIKKQKVVVADYETMYAIKYKPGWFETNKFSVELEKGMLKSVNSESTPGIKNAVESLQGIVDIGEDVLDGYIKESLSNDAKILNNFNGKIVSTIPIKCSTNE
jgi:hypothetical protein